METTRSLTFGATALAAAAALLAAYTIGQSGAHAAPAATAPVSTPAANPRPSAITVSGMGKVQGTPDVLSLSLGVEVHKPDVASAMNGASSAMKDVIAALRADGVDEKDLQTQSVSVQGDYSYDKTGSHIRGYVAVQQLTAKLRSADKAGAAIGHAVAAGGDAVRLNGLSLSLDDDSALLTQARERAFADAKAKATQYATLAGTSLGSVQSIDDVVVNGNTPVYGAPMMRMAASASMDAAPIQLGSENVSVTVTVAYGIG